MTNTPAELNQTAVFGVGGRLDLQAPFWHPAVWQLLRYGWPIVYAVGYLVSGMRYRRNDTLQVEL